MGVHGGFVDGPGASGGFREEDHPRDASGHFTDKGGGGSGGSEGASDSAETQPSKFPGWRVASDEERKSLKIPPAYTDAHLPEDPGHHVAWKAQDSKGRWKQQQHSWFDNQQAAAKWSRGQAFHGQAGQMLATIEADAGKPGANQDHALAARLIAFTGFRPGSDADTKARVKAYGATTLEAHHVTVDGDKMSFDFIGKEGVRQQHEVTDALLAREVTARKERGGKLFPETDQGQLLSYVKSVSGQKDFKTKDFRTWVATTTAASQVASLPVPSSSKEYQKQVKLVAEVVSRRLGNKPAQALQSYINPAVFTPWQAAMGASA